MVTPGMRVQRESEDGLWPATAGFAVRLAGGASGVLAPVTAAAFTRESPQPQAGSACAVGGTGGLEVDEHLSPASLAGGPHLHDYAVVRVPEGELDGALPGAPGRLRAGDPTDGTPRAVKVAVERDGEVVTLDGNLELLAEATNHTRPVEPAGGIVAVTYQSPFRLETEEPLTDDDMGAPIFGADGDAVALGVLLVAESETAALVADVRRILRRLPRGSELVGGGS